MTTVVSKMLDMAASQGRLDELSAQVDAARKAMPHWTAGDVVRAPGRLPARPIRPGPGESIRRFLDQTRDEPLSTNVFGTIGGELEDHAATRDLALAVYESSIYRTAQRHLLPAGLRRTGRAKRLVAIYMREDRTDDARRVLLDFIKYARTRVCYNQEYYPADAAAGIAAVAGKMAELGFAADAVAVYGQALAIDREIPPGSPNYIGNREELAAPMPGGDQPHPRRPEGRRS